jgi:hypothetical protein
MTKTHTIQEAAALTCYGLDHLGKMATAGEIPGAELRGGVWFLPDEWVRAKMPPPGWVSPQERADQEGVSREAIHRRIIRGTLPSVRRGARKVFVPPVEKKE